MTHGRWKYMFSRTQQQALHVRIRALRDKSITCCHHKKILYRTVLNPRPSTAVINNTRMFTLSPPKNTFVIRARRISCECTLFCVNNDISLSRVLTKCIPFPASRDANVNCASCVKVSSFTKIRRRFTRVQCGDTRVYSLAHSTKNLAFFSSERADIR